MSLSMASIIFSVCLAYLCRPVAESFSTSDAWPVFYFSLRDHPSSDLYKSDWTLHFSAI